MNSHSEWVRIKKLKKFTTEAQRTQRYTKLNKLN